MPKLTGRYAMLEQLTAEGVKYIFGNPGTTEQAFMDALQDYPHARVHPRAPGERRDRRRRRLRPRQSGARPSSSCTSCPASATPWACSTTPTAPSTPLVIYAGQHPQRGASQEPILAGDLVRLAEPLTKWAVEAQDANEIPVLLRRAFKVAMEPPRGPVFLSVPTNVMDEESEAEIYPSSPVDTRVHADPGRHRAHRRASSPTRAPRRSSAATASAETRRPGRARPARGDDRRARPLGLLRGAAVPLEAPALRRPAQRRLRARPQGPALVGGRRPRRRHPGAAASLPDRGLPIRARREAHPHRSRCPRNRQELAR